MKLKGIENIENILNEFLEPFEWGLQYIMEHQNKMSKLWNRLRQAIFSFYELNDIH